MKKFNVYLKEVFDLLMNGYDQSPNGTIEISDHLLDGGGKLMSALIGNVIKDSGEYELMDWGEDWMLYSDGKHEVVVVPA